ncbi:MAG: ABC transporter ATP-binding protein, partial [Sphingobacteriales bacterium]
DELTGLQYLNLVGRLYKIPTAELKQKIDSMAAYFFEDLLDLKKPVSGYSTGMKKKLGVCAAVLHRPDVLILDEPFTGLDPVAAQLLVQFINRYREGRTIIISSHDLGYVERVATHIGILQEGQLLYNGSLQEFTLNGANMIDQAVFNWLKPANSNLESIDWLMN